MAVLFTPLCLPLWPMCNLYLEEEERKALQTYSGAPPARWLKYVDDTWVKINEDP